MGGLAGEFDLEADVLSSTLRYASDSSFSVGCVIVLCVLSGMLEVSDSQLPTDS